MSEIKLLPCPFCGGEAKIDNNVANAVSIECTVCHASSPIFLRMGDREQKAIESWNTRKPMERILTRLEELKKVEENRADECDENGFGDGEEIYSDGCSQGRFEAFGQSIQVVKEEGGI